MRHNMTYFHLLSSINLYSFQIFHLIHKQDKPNYFTVLQEIDKILGIFYN